MTENTNAPVQEEQSLSELLQIRRDKLKELQDAGMDPFQQTKYSAVSYTHLTLRRYAVCRSRWSPYH